MKKIVRKAPMWMLMFCPYIFILDMVILGEKREIAGVPLFYLYCAFVIVVCVINWINAFTYKCEKIAKEYDDKISAYTFLYTSLFVWNTYVTFNAICSNDVYYSDYYFDFGSYRLAFYDYVFSLYNKRSLDCKETRYCFTRICSCADNF